jgi:hypothetical protein
MTIEALEGVTDQDLFDEANADEVTTEEVVTEPQAEPEQSEQHRDEQGRFAAQAEQPVTAVTEQPATTQIDDNAAMVPSWRVREIREERDATQKRLEALEAEKSKWQQPAPQASPAPAPQAEEPDPLLDPKGYKDFVLNQTREIILSERREASLLQAHRTYKTEFEEAYAAAQKQIDPVLRMKMQNSRDPGETLIEWHREQKTRAEVGNDPNAFFERRLEAYLSDQANQAKVLERIRGGAQTQPGATRQPSAVSLPPSLTRATNASTATSADDDDISDEGLWRHANS